MNEVREAFEKWYRDKYQITKPLYFFEDTQKYEDGFAQDAWEVWQAAKAQAVPEGFVLVPKEPTQELLNKMQDFFVGAFENGLTGGQSIHCAYIAMIEAQEQSQ